jgi:hypothetical protein
MMAGRVSFGSWILRVLTWDGLLQGCIALIPAGIGFLFPDRRGAIEITAVALPIAGFFLRVRAGRRQIASNHCSIALRHVQFGVFGVGILLLVFIDAALILSQVMPAGALFASKGDCLVWAILYSIYLTSMAIAIYPGRVRSYSGPEPWEAPDCWEIRSLHPR